MSHLKIRIVALLGLLCIVGIITVQIGWFIGAQKVRKAQEELLVNLALKDVAVKIYDYNQLTPPSHYIVKQEASNFYVVMTNSPIVPSLLEYWLASAFEENALTMRYDYGIYDCVSERLVFSQRVGAAKEQITRLTREIELPDWAEDNHYFAVHLPERPIAFLSDFKLWTISSALVLLISVYFVYMIWMVFRQRRLSELQRDFVNNMTHEFSTPISSIHGAAELLLKKEKFDLQYLQIIRQESQRLQMHVERSLEINSYGEQHPDFLEKKPVHIHTILQACIDKARISLPATFEINFYDQFKMDNLLADPYHLENAFQNLIENAYKYRGEQDGCLKVTLYNDGPWIKIAFADQGIGMEKKELKNIFGRFYRISSGNIHKHKGFGLGLYYVKRVMKLHKGKIRVESTKGQGSIFTLSFPNKA